MALHPESVVVVSKEQMASEIGGETVILGLRVERYFGLDAVGARVWQLIQTPTSIQELTEAIVREYDVTEERCQADLLALVGRMREAGLVEVSGAGAA